jgi:hypothetical protein
MRSTSAARGRLVERDAEATGADAAEVHAAPARARRSRARSPVSHGDRVEEASPSHWKPSFPRPARRIAARRCTRRAMRSRPAARGTRVHRRHHREQHLRGADVRGRLLAADVLLARLQREA